MLVEALSAAFVARARPGLCLESVVLLPLADGPVPAGELWRRARVSRRAMRTLRKSCVRRGLVADDGGLVRLLVDPPPVEPASCSPLSTLVSRFELEQPHMIGPTPARSYSMPNATMACDTASLVRGDHASMMSGMVRHGWIANGDPTPIGIRAREAYEPLCAQIESAWRSRHGDALIDEVIDALGAAAHVTFPWIGWNFTEFAVVANQS